MRALFTRRIGESLCIMLDVQITGRPSPAEVLELAALLDTFGAMRCPLCGCEPHCECALPCKLCAARAHARLVRG